MPFPSDLEIARKAELKPLTDIAKESGIEFNVSIAITPASKGNVRTADKSWTWSGLSFKVVDSSSFKSLPRSCCNLSLEISFIFIEVKVII